MAMQPEKLIPKKIEAIELSDEDYKFLQAAISQMRLAVATATEWTAKPQTTSRPEQVDLLCPTAR